jgi:hypothetical protein
MIILILFLFVDPVSIYGSCFYLWILFLFVFPGSIGRAILSDTEFANYVINRSLQKHARDVKIVSGLLTIHFIRKKVKNEKIISFNETGYTKFFK